MRLAALALLTAASSPPSVDINEAGRTLATLNDWRAMIFVVLVLLFLQTAERWWAGFRASRTADKFAEGAAALAKSIDTLSASQAVSSVQMQAELARVAMEAREIITIVRGRP